MSKIPAIPDFVETPASMSTTLRVLKRAVEVLGGLGQGQSLGAPQRFVQEFEPKPSRQTSIDLGDLWIKPSTRTMHFWDGREWQSIAGSP